MKELCRLHIQNYYDRQAIVTVLANAGYCVSIEEVKEQSWTLSSTFWVVIWEQEERL